MKRPFAPPGGWKGFTLIELLIVIAIILILIAIALPNFLAAQVRAKVTRERADQRTIATAIESLRTERNVLLVDFWDDDSNLIRWARFGGGPPGFFPDPPQFTACCYWHNGDFRRGTTGIFTPLTTPVAYLGSVPIDPFKLEADADLVPDDQLPPSSYQYIDNETQDQRLDRKPATEPIGVFGCWRESNGCPSGINGIVPLRGDQYLLIGFGPDLKREVPYDIPYAPTNGNISYGDVVYHSGAGPL